jgi:hypothetical protein
MWETAIQIIKTTLEGIDEIKEIFEYPLQGNPSKFPAVVFFPQTMENNFETTTENFKVYNFSMFLTVGIGNTTVKKVYSEILPKATDALVAEFDNKWNGGTYDGKRVWVKVSTGQWSMSDEQAGRTATIDMTVQVKTITNN